jgi:hypothetical protein
MTDQNDNANMFFQVDPKDPKRFAIIVTRGFVVDAYEAVMIGNRMVARAFECDPDLALRTLKGLVNAELDGIVLADHAPGATPIPPAEEHQLLDGTMPAEHVAPPPPPVPVTPNPSALRMRQPRRGLKAPPRKPV